MLVLSRKKEESIVIGNNIRVTVLEIRGNRVRLGIEAPASVAIRRQELRAFANCPEPIPAIRQTTEVGSKELILAQ